MTVAGTRWTTLVAIFVVTSAATALIVVILAQGRDSGSLDTAAVQIGPTLEVRAPAGSPPKASATPRPTEIPRTSGRAITEPLAAGGLDVDAPPSEPAGATATPPVAGPEAIAGLVVEASAFVGTGETLAVRVASTAGASASATFGGDSTPLVRTPDGYWGVIGISVNAALGRQVLAVAVQDASGATIDEGAAFVEVTYTERPVDYLELTEEQSAVLTPDASAREREQRAAQFAQFDGPPQWDGAFLLPVGGRHTTRFGEGRSYNGGPVGNFHTGEDIAIELGTPVGAAARGRVAWVGEMPIRGNSVIVDHGAGVKTGYHHLDSISVELGHIVEQGWEIGRVGSTGLSTGPHLHWELTIWGVNVDPMRWTEALYLP